MLGIERLEVRTLDHSFEDKLSDRLARAGRIADTLDIVCQLALV